MGLHEKIIIADDSFIAQDALQRMFESNKTHTVAGIVGSVDELKKLVESGVDFSLLLQDGKFPREGDGQRAAEMVREMRPDVKIVALSSDRQTFGDLNLTKSGSAREIIDAITNL